MLKLEDMRGVLQDEMVVPGLNYVVYLVSCFREVDPEFGRTETFGEVIMWKERSECDNGKIYKSFFGAHI